MRTTTMLFIASLTFFGSCESVNAGSPEKQDAVPLPKVGETVTIDPDARAYDYRDSLRDAGFRVGDPDDARFEMDCIAEPPFTVRVLGAINTTVVLRYEAPKKQKEFFGCKHGGVVLLSSHGWAALKKMEAEVAEAKAAKERRREAIRSIVNGAAPAAND